MNLRKASFLFTTLGFIACDQGSVPTSATSTSPVETAGGAVVHVAPPTGVPATDRASIEAAAAAANPGDVIQFAAGTYVIGTGVPFGFEGIELPVPRTTLVGHPAGTTLKGCDDPTEFGECEGLALTGGKQTVRGLIFESFANSGLSLNLDLLSDRGGYRVEDCTFRSSILGLSLSGDASEPSHIRGNTFVDVGVGFSVSGRTAVFEGNSLITDDPDQIPVFGQPLNVGGAFAIFGGGSCRGNVFRGNTVQGFADGWVITTAFGSPDQICENNTVQDEQFSDQTLYTPSFDLGTLVFLEGNTRDNRISSNSLDGSAGIGIVGLGATGTRIANNAIRRVSETPGTLLPSGIGIFLDEASVGNHILSTTFEENEVQDVVLLGDDNLVVARSAADRILDLGEGNRIVGRGAAQAMTLSGTVEPTTAAGRAKLELIRQAIFRSPGN